MYSLVIVVAVAISAKALHVQVLEGAEWRKQARDVSFKDFEVIPNRGEIRAVFLDRVV